MSLDSIILFLSLNCFSVNIAVNRAAAHWRVILRINSASVRGLVERLEILLVIILVGSLLKLYLLFLFILWNDVRVVHQVLIRRLGFVFLFLIVIFNFS